MSDPYTFGAGGPQAAPATLRGRIRHLGPSVIVTGSIVGSGEIILTSSLGAAAGFAMLWWVLLSCWSKSIVQAELARYVLATGDTYLRALNRVPGRIGPVSWPIWIGLAAFIPGVTGLGGIIGGAGQSVALLFPGIDDVTGTAIVAASATAILVHGNYRHLEKWLLAMVVSFTACTLACALAMQGTAYAVSSGDIAAGLRFDLPPEVLLLALSVFGYTGVNAGEIAAYSYWCIEKGYPARIGADRDDPQWLERARGWVRVMHTDVLLTLLLLTCATLPFYVLGAGVLHRMGERPEGTATIASLSNMFSAVLGGWATVVFAVGALCILYSTVISGIGAGGRAFADYLVTLGITRRKNLPVRLRTIRAYVTLVPSLGFVLYLGFRNPVTLVTVGALTAALLAPMQSGLTIWLQRRHMDPRIAPSALAGGFLVLTFLFQCVMACLVIRYVVF